jgi:large subunit ribosomal protein L3
MQGIIGKKVGMTRIFDKETGKEIPVTIIDVTSNVVQQVKTIEKDGYNAVQIGFDFIAENRATMPVQGHCRKHNSPATRMVKEFKLDDGEAAPEPGQKLGVEVFENTKFVNVSGISKGHGFSGTIKRWGFGRGRETHGNKNHRERGSIGPATYPARVFPGLKMAGQFGNVRRTVKGLQIVKVEPENNLIYLKGAVPGHKRSYVFIKKNLSK